MNAAQLEDEIVTQLQAHADAFRALGVAHLGIFGSVARNTPHAPTA